MYCSSPVFGCFIVTFTCNADHYIVTSSSIRFQWYNLCDFFHFRTHLSFANDEKCITTSTLPNDVVTWIVECLQKEHTTEFTTFKKRKEKPCFSQDGSVGHDTKFCLYQGVLVSHHMGFCRSQHGLVIHDMRF
jgi:hypothetical protein